MASVIHYTIATEAEKSPDFRRVLWTGEHTQLVIMTIPPGGEIGEEVHDFARYFHPADDPATAEGVVVEAGIVFQDDPQARFGTRVHTFDV